VEKFVGKVAAAGNGVPAGTYSGGQIQRYPSTGHEAVDYNKPCRKDAPVQLHISAGLFLSRYGKRNQKLGRLS
jgi:hypothetical protein